MPLTPTQRKELLGRQIAKSVRGELPDLNAWLDELLAALGDRYDTVLETEREEVISRLTADEATAAAQAAQARAKREEYEGSRAATVSRPSRDL